MKFCIIPPHVQSFVYTETSILCFVYFKNQVLFLKYNDMPVKPKGALAYSFTHSLLLLPSFPLANKTENHAF